MRIGDHMYADESVKVGRISTPKPVDARTLALMASYNLNRRAVSHTRRLIDAGRYVLDSDWGEVQPAPTMKTRSSRSICGNEYADWHLGLTEGSTDETKARYAFVVGDLERVHRSALIACVYRASEWRHKQIELAAHRLLQRLDKKTPERF